jgi:DNA polymerase elongation subunit (family B)
MLQVVKIAERRGFRVLHGIVDSIWVKTRQRMEWNNTINDENHKNKA